jgi:hypothetical protein
MSSRLFVRLTSLDNMVGINPEHICYFVMEGTPQTATLIPLSGDPIRLNQESTVRWLREYGVDRE